MFDFGFDLSFSIESTKYDAIETVHGIFSYFYKLYTSWKSRNLMNIFVVHMPSRGSSPVYGLSDENDTQF